MKSKNKSNENEDEKQSSSSEENKELNYKPKTNQMILDIEDGVERIYINFCNPWPRGKHHKKRLTHIRQLEKYKQFLKDGGEIYFKTDDDNLFNDSLLYFKQAGFEIENSTYDLENTQNFWINIETEHEKMFKAEGIKIKALKAVKK